MTHKTTPLALLLVLQRWKPSCEAQCCETLYNIHDGLYSKKHLINKWNKYVTGQNKSIKAQVLIAHIRDCVTLGFERYCHA